MIDDKLRKTLVGSDVEFFNGYVWKPISKYTKGEKVLIYHEDGKIEMSTPINFFKFEKKRTNRVTSGGSFDAILNDYALFFGIRRKEDTGGGNTMCMNLHEAYIRDFNYFSHYELPSTFYSYTPITPTSSMLSENKLKLMIYAMMKGKVKNNLCTVEFTKKENSSELVHLLKSERVVHKYNSKERIVEYRLPRDMTTFLQNPFIFSKKEIGFLTIQFLNYLEKNKYLIPQSRTYLDFIQFICALGGKRFYIEQNKGRLKLMVGENSRLRWDSFKIEEVHDRMYNFNVKSGFIVFKSNGIIFVLSDYKNT